MTKTIDLIAYTQLAIDTAKKGDDLLINGEPFNFDIYVLFSQNNCGTTACLMGYLSLFHPDIDSDDALEFWNTFSNDTEDADVELFYNFLANPRSYQLRCMGLDNSYNLTRKEAVKEAQKLLDRVKESFPLYEVEIE